jgi:hypothetical protein
MVDTKREYNTQPPPLARDAACDTRRLRQTTVMPQRGDENILNRQETARHEATRASYSEAETSRRHGYLSRCAATMTTTATGNDTKRMTVSIMTHMREHDMRYEAEMKTLRNLRTSREERLEDITREEYKRSS